MKRAILIILAAAIICCGCAPYGSIDIVPQATAAPDTVPVRLYFGYGEEELLSGEVRNLDYSPTARIEQAALTALIGGPLARSTYLVPLIDPKTQIKDMSSSGGYLFVTLSREFLNWPDVSRLSTDSVEYGAAMRTRRLAALSIANTLIELGNYSRVQILVDMSGDGIGERIAMSQVGYPSDEVLKPFERSPEYIFDERALASEAMSRLRESDLLSLFDNIALYDSRGDRPEYATYLSDLTDARRITGFTLGDVVRMADDGSSVVFVSYTYESDGSSVERTGVPLRLVAEGGAWRVAYSSIYAIATTQ